ncbi:hypothetical protein IV77_GL000759 [Olsenella uli DSM 7084]|nr:hypothetical protein IV77_GL000759 [Olsenella uli DSM 7084]
MLGTLVRLPRAVPKPRVMVRAKGLEPSRNFSHWNLNPARLPVPPRPRYHTAFA